MVMFSARMGAVSEAGVVASLALFAVPTGDDDLGICSL